MKTTPIFDMWFAQQFAAKPQYFVGLAGVAASEHQIVSLPNDWISTLERYWQRCHTAERAVDICKRALLNTNSNSSRGVLTPPIIVGSPAWRNELEFWSKEVTDCMNRLVLAQEKVG